ncbi:Hpt domain-containing protein [Beggiatoa alba]|nr:Hpt domain-containing protein [Beggiatoa alba]
MTHSATEYDLDDEIITDYREGFDDHYDVVINCIASLESTPENDASIDEMFRAMHTIKGNAKMLVFEELAMFLHAVEEGISALRDHKIIFTELLGEAITLSLDKSKEISENIFSHSLTDDPSLIIIQDVFKTLQKCSQAEVDLLSARIIKEITGFDIELASISQELPSLEPVPANAPVEHHFKTEMILEMNHFIAEDTPESLKEHLSYMRYLALLLESKFPHWQGRTYQLIQLLNNFNTTLNTPVPNFQLEMAIYTHDMAFVFLPDTLMLKTEKFTPEEVSLMQTHTQIAADFLNMNKDWETAQEIVFQHHENCDGTGYPNGLKEDEICIGAKMLSIVDAFIEMTTYRPNRAYKRSVLTALNEIKTQSGKQFSPELTPTFLNILVKQFK